MKKYQIGRILGKFEHYNLLFKVLNMYMFCVIYNV